MGYTIVNDITTREWVWRRTKRVAILQQRLADTLRLSSGIRVLELPHAVPDLIEALWWHPSRNTDPGRRWLQQLLEKAVASLGELHPAEPRE